MADDREVALAIGRARYGADPEVETLPGLNSSVFRLRVGGAAKILKLAPSADAAKLRLELRIVELLAAHDVPGPTVEATDLDGREIGRPFVLMASAGDKSVADCLAREDPATPDLFGEMGAVLARIHAIRLPSAGRIQHDRIVPRDRAAILDGLVRGVDAMVRAKVLSADDAAKFRALPFPDLDGRSLCHGDFHAVQCVVDGGRISAVVDWESAWAGNPDVDLGVSQAYLEFYAKPDLVGRFLAGYGSVRPLPRDHDRRSLPARMAQAVLLGRVWLEKQKLPPVRRAAGLLRGYLNAWESR